ncbi:MULTISPECIES: hypothetical protein [unclassified Sphingomonas]|uniref:hypothetical protein n=1 Tax=unclassified Sphingomonas TaxID=196159 RepID=UPI000A87482E|nr:MULTISPECIES: hypothetical protein [unclassified Sphingomonas]MDY0968982.1 hypothetical protein [Sphingomonas sp. CFBP9021]
MSLSRHLKRRSPNEWAVRFALGASAALLGYYSVTFSVSQLVVKRDPALAHRLAPYDGSVTGAYAASFVGNDATQEDRRQADSVARQALHQNPLSVTALVTLAVNADIRGDKINARRLFTSVQRLSRRNLITQLWMIEDAVGRGSVLQALHQYDVTLRVFPNMNTLLYPVLASAINDPVVRTGLIKILVGKPLWSESFITFIAASGPDPRVTAALFVELRRAGVTVPETAWANAVNALVAAKQFDAAWAYYSDLRSGADRRRSRDPRFAVNADTASQLDWVIANTGGLTTSIQGGIFDFSVPASVGGPLLQQYQLLPPGTYRLVGHSTGIDVAVGERPYWALSCSSGRELGRVEMPNSAVANGVFTGMFTVPADCPMQVLLLNARPLDSVSGLAGQIDRAELVPLPK